MRILYVTPFFAPVIGGVESVLETTCTGLASGGHSVKVLTSSLNELPQSEKRDGYSIVRTDLLCVPDCGIIPPDQFDFQAIRLMFEDLVSTYEPEVIHFHNYQMRGYSMFLNCFLHAIQLSKHAVLNTIHNDSDDPFAHYVLSYCPIDRVVTPTRKAALDLFEGGVPARKLLTVPNMIETRRFRNAKGDSIRSALGVDKCDPIILFPSRLIGREGNFIFDSKTGKGLNVMIRALPEIVEAVPNVKIMLLGNDTIFGRQILEFKHKLSGIVDTIREKCLLFFDDPIPNSLVPELNAASDIVVSLSPREAFGMVFLEAMAAGKPVVAVNSAASGVPEVVPDGAAGYLVPENDPHATAKAIVKILSDDDRRKHFQMTGMNWVRDRFDVNVVLPQLLRAYKSILAEKRLDAGEDLQPP
ncbi:MAG: glycosyltransferase family 4 protein, partial [Rhabdochlamydiaceae bacterium]